MKLFKQTFSMLLLTAFLFSASGCKKNDCTAGSDGSIVIKANMVHHTRGIKGATLRIKYCEQELPGESAADYDLNIKGSDADTFVIASGLKAGDYFFFGSGYDSLIFQEVKGGQPFTLSETSDTVKVNVYITEGD